MAISRSTAARLCTGAELELVDASSASRIRQLTPGRLQQKVRMARRLRDKYRDLARRQRLEARGKRAPQRSRPARGNVNTERKAELFDEVLARFEAGLTNAGATTTGATRAAPKETGAKRAGTRKAGTRKAGTRKAGAKQAGAKQAGAKQAGAKKAGPKKAGPKKAGAKKAGAKKAGASKASARSRRGPAGGDARPAEPAKPGPAALKGERQRPSVEDRKMVGRARTVHSHTRAATQRRQITRDRRAS
jgi:hypothetical protein